MYAQTVAQRTNESGEKFINVGLKVTPTTRDLLDTIGHRHDRPMGYIARKLLLRGLAAYARDGKLDETPAPVLPPDPYEGATFPDDVAEYDDGPPGWER